MVKSPVQTDSDSDGVAKIKHKVRRRMTDEERRKKYAATDARRKLRQAETNRQKWKEIKDKVAMGEKAM